MERRQPDEEQAEQPWRTAVLAPLRPAQSPEQQRVAAQVAEPIEGEAAGDTPNGQLVKTTPEVVQPARERQPRADTFAAREVLANVYHDPIRHTVTLLLDERHAAAVIYAVQALAADYEAHAREVRAAAATLPPESYGHTNRQFIAIRHERIASRLRRVESNYRTEVNEGGRPAE